MDTPLRETRPLTENGRGGNLYLGAEFLRQLVCPLTPGSPVIAQTIPHTAVVLLPGEPDYPVEITVHDPAQHQTTTRNPPTTDHERTRQD